MRRLNQSGGFVFVYGDATARLAALYSDIGTVKLTGTLTFLGCMAFVRWGNRLVQQARLRGLVLNINSFTHNLTLAEMSVVALAMERRQTLAVAFVGEHAEEVADVASCSGIVSAAAFHDEPTALLWVRDILPTPNDEKTPYAQ